VQQMDGFNADITEEQRAKLREMFPEVFSGGKIDFDRLRATLGDQIELGDRYGLNWKGKSGVFAKIQEKTTSTLHPQPEESIDWETTQNMFIEGDNLEVLKVLHKAYYGKIKMIYIDPPYNTGNDFVYNDDFKQTRGSYDQEAGIVDEEGYATRDDGLRVNTGGHKHSNWLSMMYPRLFLARNLLRQDGVIFVSIDDNEVHNLRLMMNEIFGEENFVAQMIWEGAFKNDAQRVGVSHEYILVFARNIQESNQGWGISKEGIEPVLREVSRLQAKYSENLDQASRDLAAWYVTKKATPSFAHRRFRYIDSRGAYKLDDPTAPGGRKFNLINPSTRKIIPLRKGRGWTFDQKRFEQMIHEGRITFISDSSVMVRRYLHETDEVTPQSVFYQPARSASERLNSLMNGNVFDFPKDETIIRRLVDMSTDSSTESIILDFFGGSGTTAHAVEELNARDGGNRKWIMVQLPELISKKSEAYKAGYKSIAEIARERIRRAGIKISKDFADKITKRETPLDLGFRSYVLGDSNFKKWNELVAAPEEIRQQTLDSLNPLEDGVSDEDLLAEILLKRGISPLVELEARDGFVFVPSENLAISLSRSMSEDLFAAILATSPSQIIVLDLAFRDDLNLKTNLILQAEKSNIVMDIL